MLPALGALSSALDVLQSLTASKSASGQPAGGQSAAGTTPFDVTGGAAPSGAPAAQPTSTSGFSQISPQTMSALIAAQSQSGSTDAAPMSPADALKDLFSQIDANGDGQITKSEFENALGAGGTNVAQADDVFNKLDANGDGSVSLDELTKALKGAGGHNHGHHVGHAGGSGDGAGNANADPLLQAISGASNNVVANSDGSTTTSITYADGSKVTLTTPAASSSASASATSSYNFIEQLIQREAQSLSASAGASLSVAA
ncbi:EF-hand domain-containing protein [Bradyrhizobium sp. NP1]|uniref:EF-hand domain-containing protein n=1 Tax=Bradyrhizobium sp. NP1 TaxID=3049772 RepID=UPI0025A5EDEA|nr:EF-hand domain-containing protein [Bradyrhizobium sp. NP1]WJR76105.1 EF-hand domain-containing protein [Bradyrhizobium sp. NP1]